MSFDFSVSILESMRISSSAGSDRFCASSITSSTIRPAARSLTRNSPNALSIAGLLMPAGSMPRSIIAASSSSRGSNSVFMTRATVVRSSTLRSSVCSSVVLPEPIAPVITTKPAWVSIP